MAESDSGERGTRVMAGRLEEVDLFSVTQFLMFQGKTGRLELARGAQSGRLFFGAGQVVDAGDGQSGEAVDAAYRLLQWKAGSFDFYVTRQAAPRRIEQDTQTLLFQLAVRTDEEGARQGDTPQVLRAKTVAARRAVAKLVRGAGAGGPASAIGVTETQFMQNVQDRLTLFVDQLPETSGMQWRQQRANRSVGPVPLRKLAVGVSALTACLLVGMIVHMLSHPGGDMDNGVDDVAKKGKPDGNSPPLPPAYTFLTAPFTPEREAEDVVRRVALKCRPASIDVIGETLDKAVVTLRDRASWGGEQLDAHSRHDAAHIVNDIFKSPSCRNIRRIDLRVQKRKDFADGEWTDVLIVDARRDYHKSVTLKTQRECRDFLQQRFRVWPKSNGGTNGGDLH